MFALDPSVQSKHGTSSQVSNNAGVPTARVFPVHRNASLPTRRVPPTPALLMVMFPNSDQRVSASPDQDHASATENDSARSGRSLIVNGDDFGLCHGVNVGIVDAHRDGILTSTTLMANGDAFEEAVALARANARLGVGCHLVLVGGRPVAPARFVRSLLRTDSETFPRNFDRARAAPSRRFGEIVTEFDAQLTKILSAGITPTHVDSHKHTHMHPQVLDALLEVAARYRIASLRRPFERFWWTPPWLPIRKVGDAMSLAQQHVERWRSLRFARRFDQRLRRTSLRHPDAFYGHVHTGLLTPALIVQLLAQLPVGTSELMCHPARLDASLNQFPTRLKGARAAERDALIAPSVHAAVAREGVRLVSFRSLGEGPSADDRRDARSLLRPRPRPRTRESQRGRSNGPRSGGL